MRDPPSRREQTRPPGAVMTDAVDGVEAGWLTDLAGLLAAGGPVVLVLLGMSVVALAIVLVKLWQFRAARLGERGRVEAALLRVRAGDLDDALAIVVGARNPVAQAVVRAVNGRRRGLPEHRTREEATRFGSDVLEDLRSYLRPLEVIASLAPLLGLFGTVLGMIGAFQQLEAAGNQVNPAVLSGGIWEALMTTAVGLAVAIPAVAALNWLERVVERVAHEMDSAITSVFTLDLAPGAVVPSGPSAEGNRAGDGSTGGEGGDRHGNERGYDVAPVHGSRLRTVEVGE